jgi:serine phosphatase RsbU (regulator of sigma subunit)
MAILVLGVLGSLLIAAVIESAARRRDAALALYAGEHQVAETLQRSLLPQLPDLPGLDLAARYLASGSGQMVGGDWFDVFPVRGGRVGLAVGDVIGHDLAAASAMAQIRATLRAYAVDGDPPVTVITRLDHLVDTFAVTQLVTVMYGVLEPPAPDGSRLLRWTNAGHLQPLLRLPSGQVEPLVGGDSVVIGAPIAVTHAQAERVIAPGSTLVLFTDGLVERPGGSIDEEMQQLADSVAATHGGADALCEQVIGEMSVPLLRDDIALLAVHLTGVAQAPAARAAVPSVRSAVSGDLVEG